MSHLLTIGDTLRLASDDTQCQVAELLGSGGQGEVYKVTQGAEQFAVKWYFPHMSSPRQSSHLRYLVQKGPPSDAFLWPIDMVGSENMNDFGYIMPLRPVGYCSIVDLMTNRADPSFHALATAGFELAHNFRELHANGLCYQDISFDNIFFHPETGRILICDNDNVAVEGQRHHNVFGTPRFMAPEVVRKESVPSIDTDLFSLSILLFYMLMIHHPLEGELEFYIKCLDLASMEQLYGTRPVFIFDPNDNSNRPVAGVHDNAIAYWPIYPQFIRDLFIQAFTQGLNDSKNGRVREGEWRNAMIRLRDSIIYCSHCGVENFYDIESHKNFDNKSVSCWACKLDIQIPPHISLKRGSISKTVMLNHNSKLYPHHLDPDKNFDFYVPQAAITQHPSDPSIWGLTNQSETKWAIIKKNGAKASAACGQSISLSPGVKIDFGKVLGEIGI